MNISDIILLISVVASVISRVVALIIALSANKIAKEANIIASRPLDEYYKELKMLNNRLYAENSLLMEQKNALQGVYEEMKKANERLGI